MEIKTFDPQKFAVLLPAEILPLFQDIYLETTVHSIESHQRLLEIKKAKSILDNFYLKDKLNLLSSKIAQLEDGGNSKKLDRLEKEYNELLSELSRVQIKKS